MHRASFFAQVYDVSFLLNCILQGVQDRPAGHIVLARSCVIRPRLLNHDILTALIGSFDSLEPQLRRCSRVGEVIESESNFALSCAGFALLAQRPCVEPKSPSSLQLNQEFPSPDMAGVSMALKEARQARETTTLESLQVLRSVFVLFFLMASQLRHGLSNEFWVSLDRHRKPAQALRPYVPSGSRSPACLPKDLSAFAR